MVPSLLFRSSLIFFSVIVKLIESDGTGCTGIFSQVTTVSSFCLLLSLAVGRCDGFEFDFESSSAGWCRVSYFCVVFSLVSCLGPWAAHAFLPTDDNQTVTSMYCTNSLRT